jgi:hypothetical protein
MGFDLAELQFCGLADTVALNEFAASFDDERGTTLREALYRDYIESGSPKDQRVMARD